MGMTKGAAIFIYEFIKKIKKYKTHNKKIQLNGHYFFLFLRAKKSFKKVQSKKAPPLTAVSSGKRMRSSKQIFEKKFFTKKEFTNGEAADRTARGNITWGPIQRSVSPGITRRVVPNLIPNCIRFVFTTSCASVRLVVRAKLLTDGPLVVSVGLVDGLLVDGRTWQLTARHILELPWLLVDRVAVGVQFTGPSQQVLNTSVQLDTGQTGGLPSGSGAQDGFLPSQRVFSDLGSERRHGLSRRRCWWRGSTGPFRGRLRRRRQVIVLKL